MSARVADAPFTSQLNHRAIANHLAELSQPPGPEVAASERAEALQRCEKASALYPTDPYLQASLASLRESSGNLEGAVIAMRRSLDLLPTKLEDWAQLGLMLVQQQRFNEAQAAFRTEFSLDPEDVSALQNLATCFIKENKVAEGIREYRRALAIKPRFGPAWLGLGLALENAGEKAEALECFQKALTNRIHRGADLATLARFAAKRGWFEAAATNYVDAIKLSAPDARLNYEAGQVFGVLGRHREAAQYFATTAQLSPSWPEAQFEWGLELGQSGQPAEATTRFQEAIRLKPELLEARLNLGVALVNQRRYAEALDQFEQVLQRSPTNGMALRYVEQLRKRITPQAN
jgi:tetratricopeptide (TPR) repeat protein